ncbi:glycosyltransferase family protein [Aureispira anguillae]|uniref:Glycosyltransferase n=1 Tax=Aureispira anguillae TaxID=2864201 RepID=A0A916DV20_9BACT|nr:glycosyltransferase [Aureispira anguillae]BDS14664.1 glycosyltransferase [Aureispira anguillae]
MRVFQFVKQVTPNTEQFEKKYEKVLDSLSYNEMRELYLNDRFYSTHILKPVLDFDWQQVNYTVWDYERLQRKWAEEKGFTYKNIKEVLFAQIEEFRPEVIYNLQPIYFSKDEIQNISGNPKKICWFAAPTNSKMDFSAYDIRLTNLTLDLKNEATDTFRNVYFYPAIDDCMNRLSSNQNRDIDILFYGQYVKGYFSNRNALMNQLIDFKLESTYNIKMHLLCQVIKEPIINIPYIRGKFKKMVFPPKKVWQNKDHALFGADLYSTISRSKIVVNAGVDFSGEHKVNMRNFETTGCGAMLLSDKGIYPKGFVAGKNYVAYENFSDLVEKATYYLEHEQERLTIANNGRAEISQIYSKENQWNEFVKICESIA